MASEMALEDRNLDFPNAVVKMAVAIALSDRIMQIVENCRSKYPQPHKIEDVTTRGGNISPEGIPMCPGPSPYTCVSSFTCDSSQPLFVCNDQSFRCLDVYGGCTGVNYECASAPEPTCYENYDFSCDEQENFRCEADVFKCYASQDTNKFECEGENGTYFDCDDGSKYDFACGELPGGYPGTRFDCNDDTEDSFDCSEKHIFNCNNLFTCKGGHDCTGGDTSCSQTWDPEGLPDDPGPGVFSCMWQFHCSAEDEQATHFLCTTHSMFSCGKAGATSPSFTCRNAEGQDTFNCGNNGTKFHCADNAYHCGKCAGSGPPYLVYEIFACDIDDHKFECDEDHPEGFDCERYDCGNETHVCSVVMYHL